MRLATLLNCLVGFHTDRCARTVLNHNRTIKGKLRVCATQQKYFIARGRLFASGEASRRLPEVILQLRVGNRMSTLESGRLARLAPIAVLIGYQHTQITDSPGNPVNNGVRRME